MLSWFFKKGDRAGAPVAAKVPPPAAVVSAAAAAPAAAGPDWAARLQDAQGDDAALLRLASSAPGLAVKMAAVEALANEAALRQAEREFRSHDRKVHRLAKQRLEAVVAQREARARAQALLQRVAALVDEADVPINHVVELDHGWASLATDLLEPEQCMRFAELRARLDAAIRERGEAQQRLHRWSGDARRLLPEWRQAIAAAARQGVASDAAQVGLAIRALMDARPAIPAAITTDLDAALAQALGTAAAVESRLLWFAAHAVVSAVETVDERTSAGAKGTTAGPVDDKVQASSAELTAQLTAPPSDPPETNDPHSAPSHASLPEPVVKPSPGWNELPPLPDAELAQILNQRHAHWLRDRAPASPRVASVTPAKAIRPPRQDVSDATDAPPRLQIESLLAQAEHSLAEGRLGSMQKHLQAIDALLGTAHAAALPDAMRARHQALRAEGARLNGWRQWGGALAREDLVAEAESLARQTQVTGDPEAIDKPKLNLAHHAQAIQVLRQRWKELDRLSAAAPLTLWQRFDQSLHTAYAPVAAQQAALKAARLENLAAREALLASLEALPLPPDPAPAPAPEEATAPLSADEAPLEWKDLVRELHAFHLAWRKLGPVEHTVPAGARQALQQRLRESVDRIELPLQTRRRAATETREQLIARALALGPGAGSRLPWPEATRQVRDLQAAWQQHARQLALPRSVETDLWARFKAATDAVFAQRHAAAAARDAELSANLATREALLERLAGVGAGMAPREIERTLAEVDRAWREPAELPRGAVEDLEARFRAARAAASQSASAAQTALWQAHCDALMAHLALCEAREAAAGATADPSQRWTAHDGLPAAWQQALGWRWERPPIPGPLAESEVDDLLLQLEVVLNLPPTPERQAEMRQLKLRALKDALEGRGQPARGSAQHADWWLAVLRQTGLTPAQRQRLHALVGALRQAPPGTLARVSASVRSPGS